MTLIRGAWSQEGGKVRIELNDGVWWIEQGDLHVDISKLLERLGLEDTKVNREIATMWLTGSFNRLKRRLRGVSHED